MLFFKQQRWKPLNRNYLEDFWLSINDFRMATDEVYRESIDSRQYSFQCEICHSSSKLDGNLWLKWILALHRSRKEYGPNNTWGYIRKETERYWIHVCLDSIVKLIYNPLKCFSYKFTIIEGNKTANYIQGFSASFIFRRSLCLCIVVETFLDKTGKTNNHM